MAVIAVLTALLGLVGVFTKNQNLFAVGGGISFLLFILYCLKKWNEKNRAREVQIRSQGQFQRTKNSHIYKAENDIEGLISRYKISSLISVTLVLIVFGVAIYFIFGMKGFYWTGIIFGLFYIPEIILLFKKR